MPVQNHSAWKTSSRVVRSGFLALLLGGASLGAAQAGQKVGWVWADQPESANYTPDTDYSFNSSGGNVSISRSSAGTYTVAFPGLGSSLFSNVLVSGYSTSGTCKVGAWSTAGASISVLCFDQNGNPQDSYFTLVYQARSGTFGSATKGLAFLWANQASNPSYTPDTLYQYNSTGATNTIVRSGTGVYTAILPGLTAVGGAVQITAYGAGAGRCKTSGWGVDVDGEHVNVLCFNASGAPSDETFTLLYATKVPVAYLGTEVTGVYGWFHKAKGQHYKLFKAYRFNNLTGDALLGNRDSKGSTEVQFLSSASYTTSNMLVTAYGFDNSYCNVDSWYPLDTNCYGQGGHDKDSQYDVSFNVTPP